MSTVEEEEDMNNMDDESNNDTENQNQVDDQQLKLEFFSICNDKGFVSKDELKNWKDITELLNDNMLDEIEFDEIWTKVLKASKSSDQLDLDGFISFNMELDELFVFDDEEDNGSDEINDNDQGKPVEMFYGDDLPAGVIFSELADDEFLIGMDELKRWGDLQDMLSSGDILSIELQNILEQIPKAPGTKDKLNEEGFENLYDAIDALFEDEEGMEVDNIDNKLSTKNVKNQLLETISSFEDDDEKMPCGLESTENEVQEVLNIVAQLETQSSNLVISSGGDLIPTDVSGDWELLYTTSSTMKFNKGLSGLVPPNGRFGGLKQTLKASKYLADVEYIEHINAGPASFDVKVTGDWELRNSVSLFTGTRSVSLSVEPDKVNYGLTSQRADHWKSLGPMNLLDIAYLDDDLRIMRGTTSTESIFIFRRI